MPKYFADDTCFIDVRSIHVVGGSNWRKLRSYMKKFTFVEIKRELPCVGPLDEAVNIFL